MNSLQNIYEQAAVDVIDNAHIELGLNPSSSNPIFSFSREGLPWLEIEIALNDFPIIFIIHKEINVFINRLPEVLYYYYEEDQGCFPYFDIEIPKLFRSTIHLEHSYFGDHIKIYDQNGELWRKYSYLNNRTWRKSREEFGPLLKAIENEENNHAQNE